MSIVRYKNKKTGTISVYESTSHYDPVTKQSRPIRKYLGTEDPETGQLIPSSGKRGRKTGFKVSNKQTSTDDTDYKYLYNQCKKECAEKDVQIKKLVSKHTRIIEALKRINFIIEGVLKDEE